MSESTKIPLLEKQKEIHGKLNNVIARAKHDVDDAQMLLALRKAEHQNAQLEMQCFLQACHIELGLGKDYKPSIQDGQIFFLAPE